MRLDQRLQVNSGQALPEALMLSIVVVTGSFCILAIIFNQIISIAVDDAIETYFYCQIQNNTNCIETLNSQLEFLHLKNIHLSENNHPPEYSILLRAETSYRYELHKQRQLHYENNIL